MRIKSKNKLTTAVLSGLLMLGNFALAQNSLPGDRAPDYRPIGTLVFRQDDSATELNASSAATHTSYMFYISTLQRALLDTNPEALEEQAKNLEISPGDVERLYTLLNEFNTRSAVVLRESGENACRLLLDAQNLTRAGAKAAVASINPDAQRDEILQSVLQTVKDTFGDELLSRVQRRVEAIRTSPQFAHLEEVEKTVRAQTPDDVGYLNEQCAAVQE